MQTRPLKQVYFRRKAEWESNEQILCLTLVMFVGLVFTWDSVAIGEVIELQSCPGNMKVGDSSE